MWTNLVRCAVMQPRPPGAEKMVILTSTRIDVYADPFAENPFFSYNAPEGETFYTMMSYGRATLEKNSADGSLFCVYSSANKIYIVDLSVPIVTAMAQSGIGTPVAVERHPVYGPVLVTDEAVINVQTGRAATFASSPIVSSAQFVGCRILDDGRLVFLVGHLYD